MAISMKSKIIRSSHPVAELVDDELVMADIEAGKYYGLNDIGTAIWKKIETKISVEDLCKQLCETYAVAPEQCSAEVIAFLKDLESRKLIFVE